MKKLEIRVGFIEPRGSYAIPWKFIKKTIAVQETRWTYTGISDNEIIL